jgi:uncharacterized protein YbaP (TraB family)
MRIKKLLLALVCCVSLNFLSVAQSKYPSILWEIKKTKNSKPSYLFGTYHVSSKGVFKLGDSIFVALKNVDMVAKEVNVNTWQRDQNIYDELQYAYENYTNEYRNISFDEHSLKKTNTIEKLPEFLGLVPNFVNYFLYRNNAESDGFEEEIYLDKFISSAGFKYGKEVKGLENYLESNILSIEGMRDQADLEKVEKKELPGGMTYKEMSDKMYDGYLNNTLDMMDSFMIYQFESEAYYNKFLVARNYNQADSIDYYIKTRKTIFAAVGCGHLPGKKGVIEILRSKGYILRPVSMKKNGNEAFEALKKVVVPITLSPQKVDDVMEVKAPGAFYTYYKTDIFNSYGYVDMKNDAFFYIARLVNNAPYFAVNNNLVNSIDSLLYSSIKGEIVSRKQIDFKGYKCMDVTAKVKNKDIERYRFIVTPFEVIKFQVGGKNEYANAPIIDSFFSSIQINDLKPLDKNLSFNFKTDYKFNQWVNLGNSKLQSKQRYSNYDEAKDQLNSCIKLQMPLGDKLTDSIVMQLIRESILSSEIFPKNTIDKSVNMPLVFDKINQLKLANGKTLSVKCVSDFPYVYLLSSLNKKIPDSTFINDFQLKKYALTNNYSFTDTARGYKVSLPFKLELDPAWKFQMDRKKKKYDDIKSPNEDANLTYNPSLYGNDTEIDQMQFEDKVNMESIKMKYTTLDKELYYPTALSFWENLAKEYPTNNYNYNDYGSYGGAARRTVTRAINSIKNNYKDDDKNNVKKLVYDTASSKVQRVSFEVYDSLGKRNDYHQYILVANKIYHIEYTKNSENTTAFQNLFNTSFQAIDTSKPIKIYQSNFAKIVEDYNKANVQKRPNVLSRLNNIHLGIKDFEQAKSIYNGLTQKIVEQNILKRKVVDMVANGLYSDTEWPTISKWLFEIFNNTDNNATLRIFAAESIVEEQKFSDADMLLKNFYETPNPYQKRFASDMRSYLRNVYPKNTIIPRIKLNLKENDDYELMSLADSGYFNKDEKLAAFNFYKKTLDDETLNLQLSQEKNEYLFKENEINETMADTDDESNFELLLTGFNLFYSVSPKDPFFKESFDKILSSNSKEDMMQLLEILVAQKETDYDLVNKILGKLSNEPSKLYDINRIFFENKKYDKLLPVFKNKQKIAKYLILGEKQYDELDSIIYIGAKKYPYNKTDSVYFFKYIEDRQTNANIAYVMLDTENNFLESKPNAELTSEQISATETYEKLSAKLMRHHYTSTYFSNRDYFYNNRNYSKNVTSDE